MEFSFAVSVCFQAGFWVRVYGISLSRCLSDLSFCIHKLRASSLKHKGSCFHHLNTLFVEGVLLDIIYHFSYFFWSAHLVFLDVLSLFHLLRYRNRACWISIWCHFLDISILFSSFGVLWRPRSHRGSSQVGYIVPASWEIPIWNVRTPVCIICILCLKKATLSGNWIYVFNPFD